MADVQVRTSVESSPSQHQPAKSDADPVSHSLGEPSRKKNLKVLDLLVVLVTWICLAIAVIAITPRLDVAWTLQLQHQLQVIGLMLSIMSQCTQIVAPKLWIMVEACSNRPKLQNFDAIFRNSIMTSNAHLVWRALLLAVILLPIGLSLSYKVFVGGHSTHDFGNHASWYGMIGAPGLTRNTVLKFGPSYMTNATHPPLFLTPHCQFRFCRFSRACTRTSPVRSRSPQMYTQQSQHTTTPSRLIAMMTLSGTSTSIKLV